MIADVIKEMTTLAAGLLGAVRTVEILCALVIALQLIVVVAVGYVYVVKRLNRYDEKLGHIIKIIEANDEDIGLLMRGIQRMGETRE